MCECDYSKLNGGGQDFKLGWVSSPVSHASYGPAYHLSVQCGLSKVKDLNLLFTYLTRRSRC